MSDVSNCTTSAFHSLTLLNESFTKPPGFNFSDSLNFHDAVFVEMYNPGAKDLVDVPPPPVQMIVPPPIPPRATPPIDELIQQSQWNLQQQEQHMHTLRQVQNTDIKRWLMRLHFLVL